MKSLDIRSEGAVKLLAEFLDLDTGNRSNAQHFAHGKLLAVDIATLLSDHLRCRALLLHALSVP